MKSPQVPKAPDPVVTAQAQTQSNKDTLAATTAAQNTNQYTPLGSLEYASNGTDANGNPMWKATTNLSPEQQQILDQLQTSQIGLGGAGNNLVNASYNMYSNAPDFSEQAGTQTKINMDRQAGYMQPYFTQQNEQLDNQLRNQGLLPGTPAYDRAMRSMRDTQNQSIMSFLNQTQPIAFQQAQAQYNQPIDTLSKMFGLTQPASLNNSFVATPKNAMNQTDVAGITNSAYQNQMEQYKARLAQQNAMMQGIFGIGTGLMML